MTASAEQPATDESPRAQWLDASVVALVCVLIATTVMRLTVGVYQPLWLDETQTGMLVSQPTLADFARQCAYDINAPLYYVLARIWGQFSGVSDHALRLLPSAIGIASPLLALVPTRLIDRQTRLTWCALIACWVPGITYSQEARWYSLALFMGIANTVAFIAVMARPTQGRAWLWTSVTSLLILSHYYGALLGGIQGVVYLFIHRRRALATWPAALAFVPAAASIAVHAERLILFTTPVTTWIPLMRPLDLIRMPAFIVGGALLLLALWVWAAIGLIHVRLAGARKDVAARREDRWPLTACACSLAATAVAMGVGFFAPVCVDRYLTAFVPGALLGLATSASRMSGSWRLASAALASLFFACTVSWAVGPKSSRDIHDYNFEYASEALIPSHPTRLVFFWDNPLRPERSDLAGLGGFFFARAGRPVAVDPIVVQPGQDPNPILLNHAAGSGAAILWIADLGVRGTAARRFHPAIAKWDPRWRCRDFSAWHFRSVACRLKSEWPETRPPWLRPPPVQRMK